MHAIIYISICIYMNTKKKIIILIIKIYVMMIYKNIKCRNTCVQMKC